MILSHDYSRIGVYTKENRQLNRYMTEQSFDVRKNLENFERWRGFKDVIKRTGLSVRSFEKAVSTKDPELLQTFADKIRDVITPEEKKEFLDSLVFNRGRATPAKHIPAWHHMSQKREIVPRDTWLIHFTDQKNQGGLLEEGFTRGVSDFEKLPMTRRLQENDKKYGGYAFAYFAASPEAAKHAYGGAAGNSAVMFQASGVEVYHKGDFEDQVIFWGKAIDPRTMVSLQVVEKDNYGGSIVWGVVPREGSGMAGKDRKFAFKGKFDEVVDWVEQHWFQYRKQIMGK